MNYGRNQENEVSYSHAELSKLGVNNSIKKRALYNNLRHSQDYTCSGNGVAPQKAPWIHHNLNHVEQLMNTIE